MKEGQLPVQRVTDGSDRIPPTAIVKSGAEIRGMVITKKRRELLNENGEDFFVKEGESAYTHKMAQWTKEANIAFPDQGDYSIPIVEGSDPVEYDYSKAEFLGDI
jgi:hypothetical protein